MTNRTKALNIKIILINFKKIIKRGSTALYINIEWKVKL